MKFDKEARIGLVARSLVAKLGTNALPHVHERIEACSNPDDAREAEFWRSVEQAIARFLRRA